MVLYTIINEYDILQAQEREMNFINSVTQNDVNTEPPLSTELNNHLRRTQLCQF